MPRDWTPKQRALMDWLSLPGDEDLGKGKGLRQPKTLTALAAQLGVTRETLYEWQTLPGWSDAMVIAAEKTFRGLKPDFLKAMGSVLLKPSTPGYAQVAMAFVRYVEPTIEEHEASGLWQRILPDTTETNKDDTERIASEELRALPPGEREIILNFMNRVRNREGSEILTERETFQVRRMTTEYQDTLEIETLVKQQETGTLEIVPVNGTRPDETEYSLNSNRQIVTTSGELQNTRPSLPPVVKTSTNKWKPKRKK